MIRVQNLTRYFGETVAVDRASFHVEEGQVVGFLGPNGAGKTTTLRILTCFLPATSGEASVAGHDVFRDPLGVRKCIGYLPENVPLYPEMRVSEFLTYRARLKGLRGARRRQRVGEVLDRCAIADVRRRVIGQLSRGYRQRVGIADALVGDPGILILDEPTVGLDPNQIRETRKLIKELGREHTILLSTHILPEVEMVCDSVIIIDQGRIAAHGKIEDLRRQLAMGGGRIRLQVKGPTDQVERSLAAIAGVRQVRVHSEHGNDFLVLDTTGSDVREEIFDRVVRSGWKLLEMHNEMATLEDIFVRLTMTEQGARS